MRFCICGRESPDDYIYCPYDQIRLQEGRDHESYVRKSVEHRVKGEMKLALEGGG